MSKVREVTISVTCKTETALSEERMIEVIESLFNDYDILSVDVSCERRSGEGEFFELADRKTLAESFDPITQAQREKQEGE